jgi:hypothetical protein
VLLQGMPVCGFCHELYVSAEQEGMLLMDACAKVVEPQQAMTVDVAAFTLYAQSMQFCGHVAL